MKRATTTFFSIALVLSATAQNINYTFPALPTGYNHSKKITKDVILGANANAQAGMRPQQEEEWIYLEGEWEKGGDYYYQYDQQGNIINKAYDDGSGAIVTQYEFNENNMVTQSIETYTNDGVKYKNSAKRIIAYDPKVTNVITESESYKWINNNWVLTSDGHTYKRVITRNDKGNVINVEIYTYFMEEYHLQMRSTITNNEDGLAEELKYEELVYDENNNLQLKEIYTIKDMTWYITDGQILAMDDYNWLITNSHNKMKKGKIYMGNKLYCNINASYEENGNYNLKITYPSQECTEVIFTYTDNNGSYIVNTNNYKDNNSDNKFTEDEIIEQEEFIVLVDQYGRVIQETAYIEDEILYGAKFEYTYLDEYGSYPIEQVFMDYNFETEEYVPFLKIIGKDFIDVAAIYNVINDNTDGDKCIYNLNGMRLDISEEQLPAGIYIIKENGKVIKKVIR